MLRESHVDLGAAEVRVLWVNCSGETQRQCSTVFISNEAVCENNTGAASFSPHVHTRLMDRPWQFQTISVSQETHKHVVKQTFQTKKYSFYFKVEW